MHAKVDLIGKFSGGKVYNFECQACQGEISSTECNSQFSLIYVRRGNFKRKSFNQTLDVHSNFVMLEKPGFEYRINHIHQEPDRCLYVDLKPEFVELLAQSNSALKRFLKCPDQPAHLIPASPLIHQLQWNILNWSGDTNRDPFSLEPWLLELVGSTFAPETDGKMSGLTHGQKRNYLDSIDNSREFIHDNFTEAISLGRIADHANMSPFHFNRIFKLIKGISPYQYLSQCRLQYSALLLRDSSLSVSEICFSTGFSSPEHYATIFRKSFGISPSSYRKNPHVHQD